MIGAVTVVALIAVLVVGVVVLIDKPAEPRRVLRTYAVLITTLVSAVLSTLLVDDSDLGRSFLFNVMVPLGAVLLPLLGHRLGWLGAAVADLVAAVGIIAAGLALGLGVGGTAFLPVALLFVGSAASGRPRPLPTSG